MAENNTSPVPAKANERTYTNKDEIAPDSGAYNAVELDIVTADDTPSQGSGVSIGDGLVLTSSHIFIDNENETGAEKRRMTLCRQIKKPIIEIGRGVRK